MSIHIKTMLFGVLVAMAIGFMVSNSAGQTTGPAALAAKQDIKAQVISALGDGKITQDERRSILMKAKNVCTAKEYVGLVETINRLSPPDSAISAELGYAPIADKQLMASFPSPDLSWIEKTVAGSVISKPSLLNDITPNQLAMKDTRPRQTVVVREIITKQTIVKETAPTQSVAKAATPKQTVTKTTKQNGASKVVILPPPPQQKDSKQSNPPAAGKAQNKIAKSDESAPPMPPAEILHVRNADTGKPAAKKLAETSKKRAASGDEVTIQQPAQLLNKAEKTSIKHAYTDYSVPVLNTPSAAMLSQRKIDVVKASYEEILGPDENSQSIIRH